jgi:hypothetical protein
MRTSNWATLAWEEPICPDSFLIPESHYASVEPLGLSLEQRLKLNRLFTSFTCELFIHFELYLVTYLQRFPQRFPFLSERAVTRFIGEEQVHIAAFERLLRTLRPDLYAPNEGSLERQFLRWSRADDRALRLSPVGTFFLLAWLFEEITLYVPHAFADGTAASPLVRSLMELHAKDERSHVAIDKRALNHMRQRVGPIPAGAQTLLTLPLLAYVDSRVAQAWKRLARLATTELQLTPRQAALLDKRVPTQSDRLGTASFARKLRTLDLPGSRALCWTLLQNLGAPSPAEAMLDRGA